MKTDKKFTYVLEFYQYCKLLGFGNYQEVKAGLIDGKIPDELVNEAVERCKEKSPLSLLPYVYASYALEGKLTEKADQIVETCMEIYRATMREKEVFDTYNEVYVKGQKPLFVQIKRAGLLFFNRTDSKLVDTLMDSKKRIESAKTRLEFL